MKRIRKIGLLLLAVDILFSAACHPSKKKETVTGRGTEFEKLNISAESGEFLAFAVSPDGDVFSKRIDGSVVRAAADGTVQKTYTGMEDATLLCCMGDRVYAYQEERETLVCLNPESGKLTVILEHMGTGEADNLVAAGGKLYLLAADGEQHMRYHGGIYELDVDRKRMAALPITEVSAIYGAADGTLYYCREYGFDLWGIYAYTEEGGVEEAGPVVDFAELDESAGTPTAFILEQDFLAYTTLTGTRVTVVSLKDTARRADMEDTVFNAQAGMRMQCVAGNIVYYTYKESGEIKGVYLPEIELKENTALAENPKQKGTVTIATPTATCIDTKGFYGVSKISAKVVDMNGNDAEYTAMMAGNEEVDIYIFDYHYYDMAKMLEAKGIYAPLNSSSVITAYRDKCFDYIAEDMTAENGDIWALPYAVTCQAMFYVPENFEKYGLDMAQIESMEGYLDLSEKTYEWECGVYTEFPMVFGEHLWKQYDNVYQDFRNGRVEYRTELFSRYFEKMWSGWDVSLGFHSYPPGVRRGYARGEWAWDLPEYQKDLTLCCVELLYKYESLEYRKEEEGWRIMGMPKLTPECKENYVDICYAVINPGSKNKELALAYLEAVAEHPGKLNAANLELIFKDESMYEGGLDLSNPMIRDAFNLVKNSTVPVEMFPEWRGIVEEYQAGRYTVEEAVEKAQRTAEMWLNE